MVGSFGNLIECIAPNRDRCRFMNAGTTMSTYDSGEKCEQYCTYFPWFLAGECSLCDDDAVAPAPAIVAAVTKHQVQYLIL